MREILFRGKSLETGEWVYGYPFVHAKGTPYEEVYILEELDQRDFISDIWKVAVAVDPKTVGQFIGSLDRQDNKIFEGDITGVFLPSGEMIQCELMLMDEAVWKGNAVLQTFSRFCEVVGNIFDTPELVDEKTQKWFKDYWDVR